jgi:hypothetical protein
LWALGSVPQQHRSDSLSAAFRNLERELGNGILESKLAPRRLQLLDEVGCAHKQYAPSLLDEGESQRHQQVSLSRPVRAKEEQIGALIEPAVVRHKRHHLRLADQRHDLENAQEDLTRRYEGLVRHYGMQPTRNNPGDERVFNCVLEMAVWTFDRSILVRDDTGGHNAHAVLSQISHTLCRIAG